MLVYPQELSPDFMGYLLFYIVDYKQVLVFLSPSSETKKATVKYVYHSNESESTWSGLICKALHRVFAAPTRHIFVCYFYLLVL